MKRRWLLGSVAAIAGVLMLAFALLLYSPTGLHWALARVEAESGGVFSVGSATGRLAGPFTLKDVHISSSALDVDVPSLQLDWRPAALLIGHMHVLDASLDGISVVMKARDGAGEPALPGALILPVDLRIDTFSLADCHLRLGADRTLTIDRLTLAAHTSALRLTLDRLDAAGPGYTLRALGWLGTQGAHRLHLDTTYRLELPADLAPLKGSLSARGNLEGIDLRQQLSAPAPLSIQAHVAKPLTAPSFKGRLDLPLTPVSAFAPGTTDLKLGAALEFSGDPQTFEARGQIDTPADLAGKVDVDTALAYANGSLHIQSLTLATASSNTRLELTGTVAMQASPVPDLVLRWQGLRWPLAGATGFPLGDGKLRITAADSGYAGTLSSTVLGGSLAGDVRFSATGTPRAQAGLRWSSLAFAFGGHPVLLPKGALTLAGSSSSAYTISLDTRADVNGLSGDLKLRASGREAGLALEEIRLATLGGSIEGSADIDWRERPRWQADLHARRIDPGVLWPAWRGRLQFRVQSHGDLGGENPAFDAQLSAFGGRLHGQQVSGGGALALADGSWRANQLAVRLGSSLLKADGGIADKGGLGWQLTIRDAATLAEGAQGQLTAHGRIRSGADGLRLDATADAKSFQLAGLAIGTLKLDAGFDTALTGPVRLALNAADLSYADAQVRSAILDIAGPADAQTIHANVVSNLGAVRLEGVGRIRNRVMNLTLSQADIDTTDSGNWRLTAPASLSLSGRVQTLKHSCWQAALSEICADAGRKDGDWQLKSRLEQVPLKPLGTLLPESLALKGSLSGTLDARTSNGQLHAQATFESAGGSVQHSIGDQPLPLLNFTRAHLRASLTDRTLDGKIELALADDGFVNARLRTQVSGDPQNRSLDASLRARTDDLGLLPILIPDLGGLTGQLQADITLTGTAAAPEFGGSASLERGDATLPRLGIHLKDVKARIKGAGTRVHIDLGAASGGGRLNISADAERDGTHWRAHGKLAGSDFQAIDIPEATIHLSPALDFTAAGHRLEVDGSLDVPKARLTPRDLSGTVQVSDDQVIVGANAPSQPRWQITADIRTRLGDDVHFDGFGLSGRIQGGVRLREQPGRLTTGSGELTIADGKYKAYGQQLDIARGRLLFSGGPVVEPGLDIRATRTAGEVTAGVDIRGTLRSPTLSVFSDPPMPQSQAMSYLLLGHGINEANTSEQNTLNNAAVAVGGELLAQQLNRRLGFGEVSVENGDTPGQTSLFLGKYLSPRLYIGYGVGLFQQLSLFKVRYELSKKWTLQAESGSRSSADLLYTIER